MPAHPGGLTRLDVHSQANRAVDALPQPETVGQQVSRSAGQQVSSVEMARFAWSR
ncbi:hypothetical protein [Microtetraspora sp. NBRC 16547]|uniref:hypothetical protein n=1 Tax=Microtetraspora sp. NBRC 16547 TaxID=3030993 RepID=UPI0025550326|nr:hypothetical protein [Microtetraspora sp. NBRC 16547]